MFSYKAHTLNIKTIRGRRFCCCIMAKGLLYSFEIIEFERKSRCYVPFQFNTLVIGMKPFIPFCFELNRITSVRLTWALGNPIKLIFH